MQTSLIFPVSVVTLKTNTHTLGAKFRTDGFPPETFLREGTHATKMACVFAKDPRTNLKAGFFF